MCHLKIRHIWFHLLQITFFFASSSDARVVPLPSAIGWPPVHTSRRNIVTAMQVTKTSGSTILADGPMGSMTTHADGEKNTAALTDSTVVATRPPANMFAKVHMDGCTIGRKINLRAHGSYESLSRVLTKMTRNFFCRKYPVKTYFYFSRTF